MTKTRTVRGSVAGASGRRSRGMVTLELAIGIMSAAIVLFCLSAAVGMLILQDKVEHVAAQAARFAARGDDDQLADVRKRMPKDTRLTVDKSDGWVRATASAQRSWGRLGPFTVTGRASAPLEPGQP